jgi:hypothetical protein
MHQLMGNTRKAPNHGHSVDGSLVSQECYYVYMIVCKNI